MAEGPVSSYGSRALLVAALLLILNPAASHALARAELRGMAAGPLAYLRARRTSLRRR